jgi:CRISPR-associated protein Csh1
MIQQLKELTSILPDKDKWQQVNEGLPDFYDRGIALCFDPQGRFSSVQRVTGNQGVIYRSGPPNGTDLTPCCKLAKTTDRRLPKAVRAMAEAEDVSSLSKEDRAWLYTTITDFASKDKEIWQAVQAAVAETDIDGREHRGYVFWARKDGTRIEPVFSWEASKELLVQTCLTTWKKTGGVRQEACCFICGDQKSQVVGNFALLSCYNLDKIGSIAGGFSKRLAHRNFPVCTDCMFDLAQALTFVRNHLISSMAGQSYMLLPVANTLEVRERLHDAACERPHLFTLTRQRDLVADEMDILDEFQDAGDQLAFALVFFQEEQASWRIQAEVQEVLPSRMHALYAARETLAKLPELCSEKDGQVRPFVPSAQTFRNFADSAGKGEDTFRAWLCALFEGRAIHARHFLHNLIRRIVHTGRATPRYLPHTVRQAWGLYQYAAMTGLIPYPKQYGGNMQDVIPESSHGRYVADHPEFFNRPEKVVAFLTGCYVSVVTSVQYKKRGATPFAKKFTGRVLSPALLQRLYREGRDKLYAYDALGLVSKGLDPDLAQAWVACGENWEISDEESTFAFFLGNSLAYRIGALDRESQILEDEPIPAEEMNDD